MGKVLVNFDLPLMIVGDYNQVLDPFDKLSSCSRGMVGVEWLRAFVEKFNLANIPGFGVHFTWTNNWKGRDVTFERIDQAMANPAWLEFFPSAALFVYPILHSDHSPLLVDTHWVFRKRGRGRPRRFEERWLSMGDVSQITRRVWEQSIQGSVAFRVVQKQKWLMRHLSNWNELSFRHLRRKLEDAQLELKDIQKSLRDVGAREWHGVEQLTIKDQQLRWQIDQLLEQQEMHWAQRAKERWLALGNKNTNFFHKAATVRMRRNRIVCLKGSDGHFVHDPEAIEQLFLSHFKALFQCDPKANRGGDLNEGPVSSDAAPACFQPLSVLGVHLSSDQVRDLEAPFVEAEVRDAVFQMGV